MTPRCLSLCRWLRVSERAFDRLIFIATVYHVCPEVQRRVADDDRIIHFFNPIAFKCRLTMFVLMPTSFATAFNDFVR